MNFRQDFKSACDNRFRWNGNRIWISEGLNSVIRTTFPKPKDLRRYRIPRIWSNYIVGGLNISPSEIGWSVSNAVCMHTRNGARNCTCGLRSCTLTFRTPPAIRCWNVWPLVGATQYPPSPFPLLPGISVAGPREFQTPLHGRPTRPYFAILSVVRPVYIARIIYMGGL